MNNITKLAIAATLASATLGSDFMGEYADAARALASSIDAAEATMDGMERELKKNGRRSSGNTQGNGGRELRKNSRRSSGNTQGNGGRDLRKNSRRSSGNTQGNGGRDLTSSTGLDGAAMDGMERELKRNRR